MHTEFIHTIERKLMQPLPGREAQFRMAHLSRRIYEGDAPEDALQAAVLALFFLQDERWQLVLIERESGNMRDRHRGQISFPGGRHDETDPDMAATAIREAEEEIGVHSAHIRLLGALTPLYIPVSHFNVHPYVGFLKQHPGRFIPQPGEVKAILETPLEMLLNPTNRRVTNIRVADYLQLQDVPYFDVHGKIVWGATAMILSELLEIIS